MKHPLFKVHVPTEETLVGLETVLRSGFINEGEQVTQLTHELGDYLRSDTMVLLNSCTSAITLALRLAGVGPYDDVLTTPMTCIASNTPIAASGARIVWVDIDPNTGMVTPQTIEDAITPQTKAVVIVAWAGTPPNLRSIQRLCSRHGIKLILDAAHAFGAYFGGKPIHDWADYTCYSFQAIKHFTTGDGGALVCRDPEDHERARSLKWFGLDRDRVKDRNGDWKGQQWDVDVVESGYKFNMNNLAAAIGLSQLPYIDSILDQHRANSATYDLLFSGCRTLRTLDRHPEADGSAWVHTILLDSEVAGPSRDELLVLLNSEGIGAGIVHVPNDGYTAFRSSMKELPGTRIFSALQFSLPCGWWMTEDDIYDVAARVMVLSK
jgi:dTDP-4-amino-4,6-dideoxygalactose transaminase